MRRNNQQKKGRLEINSDAAKVLRTVGDNEAFHFYTAIGSPTGEKAANLPEFLERIKTVKLESLEFHLQRKDFQNWLKKVLGDSGLARKVERIHPSQDRQIRAKLRIIIEKHVEALKEEMPLALLADEDSILASTS